MASPAQLSPTEAPSTNSTSPWDGRQSVSSSSGRGVIIGIAIFWGMLTMAVVFTSAWTCYYVRRRRRAALTRTAPPTSLPSVTSTCPPSAVCQLPPRPPVRVPIIVQSPGDERAFAYKLKDGVVVGSTPLPSEGDAHSVEGDLECGKEDSPM